MGSITGVTLSEVMEIDTRPGTNIPGYIVYHIERYGRDAANAPSDNRPRQPYYSVCILKALLRRGVAVRNALAQRLETNPQFPIGAEGGQADWEAAWRDVDYLRSNGFTVNDGGL